MCDECTDGDTCTVCNEDGTHRDGELGCICYVGYYDNFSHAVCPICADKCDTCSDADNCFTCKVNRVIETNCGCQDGMWDNDGTCEDCGYKCATCEVSATECT